MAIIPYSSNETLRSEQEVAEHYLTDPSEYFQDEEPAEYWNRALHQESEPMPDYEFRNPVEQRGYGHRYIEDYKVEVFEGIGKIFISVHFTDNDQTPYLVARGKSDNPQVPFKVAGTTAWGTGVEGGHNMHTAVKLMEAGFDTIQVGPEGEYADDDAGRLKKLNQARKISIGRIATNFHAMLTQAGEVFDEDNSQVALIGESRGAMAGMGILAKAEQHERDVLYADLTAICFMQRYDHKELVEYFKQMSLELPSLTRQLGRISIGELVHISKTIPRSRAYPLHFMATWPALRSGETGELAAEIPREQQMHIRQFRKDTAGRVSHVRQAFAPYPNVTIEETNGSHLSIKRPDTLDNILIRLNELQEQYREAGGDMDKIDFKKVRTAAREAYWQKLIEKERNRSA